MPDSYPYTISNNRIEMLFDQMNKAARPERLNLETLRAWGFTSSNDRALSPLLKRLGVLDNNGNPTDLYDDVADKRTRGAALSRAIRSCYSELFAINQSIHEAPEDEIKSAMARVTGKDETSIERYFATFKRLVEQADFATRRGSPSKGEDLKVNKNPKPNTAPVLEMIQNSGSSDKLSGSKMSPSFHYNIQVHLPPSTDIKVYRAIFAALKESFDFDL